MDFSDLEELTRKDQRHLLAIGRFIVSYSQLEMSLRAMLSAKFTETEDAHLVLEPLYAMQLFEMLVRLRERRGIGTSESRRRFAEFKGRIGKMNDRRLDVAHGIWAGHVEGGFSARRKATWKFEDVEELEKASWDCDQLMTDLIEFRD